MKLALNKLIVFPILCFLVGSGYSQNAAEVLSELNKTYKNKSYQKLIELSKTHNNTFTITK